MADIRTAKVGDLIVVERRRRQAEPEVLEMEVVKVGREYLYATEPSYRNFPHMHGKFRRDNGDEHTGYSPYRTAYLTRQELDDYRRLSGRRVHARRLMNAHGMKLDRLAEEELETLIALLEKAYG